MVLGEKKLNNIVRFNNISEIGTYTKIMETTFLHHNKDNICYVEESYFLNRYLCYFLFFQT